MAMTFDQMMKLEGRRFETLLVPEIGGEVRLAELSASRSLEFKKLQAKREREKDDGLERQQMICLLVGAIVDDQGTPVLDDKKAAKFLDAMSFQTLQLIVSKIMEMMVPQQKDGEKDGEKDGDPSGN